MAQLDQAALAAIQGTVNKTQLNRMRERNRLMENIAAARHASQQDALNLSSVIQAQQQKAQQAEEQASQGDVQAQRQAASNAVGGGGTKSGSILTGGDVAAHVAGSDFGAQNATNQFESAVAGSAQPQTSPGARAAFAEQAGVELPPSTHPRQEGGIFGTGMGFGDLMRQRINQRLGIPTPAERAAQQQQFTLNEQAIASNEQLLQQNAFNFSQGVDRHLQAVSDNFTPKPPFSREGVLNEYSITFGEAVQAPDLETRMRKLNDARSIIAQGGSLSRDNAQLKNDLLRAQIDASRALTSARGRENEVSEAEARLQDAKIRKAEADASIAERKDASERAIEVSPFVRAGMGNTEDMPTAIEVGNFNQDLREAVKAGEDMPDVYVAGMVATSRGNSIPIYRPEDGRVGHSVKIETLRENVAKAMNFNPPTKEDGTQDSLGAVTVLDQAAASINEEFGEDVVGVEFILLGPDGEPVPPELDPNTGEPRDPMTDPRNNAPGNSFMIRLRSNAQDIYSDIPGQADVVDTVLQQILDDVEEVRGSVVRSGGSEVRYNPFNAWVLRHVAPGGHPQSIPVDEDIVREFDLFSGPMGGVSASEAEETAFAQRLQASRELSKVNAEISKLENLRARTGPGLNDAQKRRLNTLKGDQKRLSAAGASFVDRLEQARRGASALLFPPDPTGATAEREGFLRQRSGQ